MLLFLPEAVVLSDLSEKTRAVMISTEMCHSYCTLASTAQHLVRCISSICTRVIAVQKFSSASTNHDAICIAIVLQIIVACDKCFTTLRDLYHAAEAMF